MAAITNAADTAGPATFPAVRAVSVKIPAPMTTATPKTVRSHAVRSLRSLVSGSSVSRIDCSIDLVRNNPVGLPPRCGSPLPLSWMATSASSIESCRSAYAFARPEQVGFDVDAASRRDGRTHLRLGSVDGVGDRADVRSGGHRHLRGHQDF